MTHGLWFRAKTHGWGWTPSTREGWVVTAIYVTLLAGWIAYRFSTGPVTIGLHFNIVDVWPALALTAVLLIVCWLKGERPKWRR